MVTVQLLAVPIHFCGVSEHILSGILQKVIKHNTARTCCTAGKHTHTCILLLEDAEVCFGTSHDVVWFHMWWGEGDGDSFHSRDAYLTFPVNQNHVNITACTHIYFIHTSLKTDCCPKLSFNFLVDDFVVITRLFTQLHLASGRCVWTDVYRFLQLQIKTAKAL